MPDYPCGKSGKCLGPQRGLRKSKKIARALNVQRCCPRGHVCKKLDYELGKTVVEPHESGDCIELPMYKLTTAANLQSVLQTEIALRIYLCLMVTNCSGERPFSKLKRIRNDLRLTMYQYRLNHLILMILDHEVLREIELTELIDNFAKVKARKMPVLSS